jgi:hypothetical protein
MTLLGESEQKFEFFDQEQGLTFPAHGNNTVHARANKFQGTNVSLACLACAVTRAGLWLGAIRRQGPRALQARLEFQKNAMALHRIGKANPLDNRDSVKRDGAGHGQPADTTSHFSAALNQHYPQGAVMNLYECSASKFAAGISDGAEEIQLRERR